MVFLPSQNKAERERNRLEQLNEDLGSPSPNRLRVPRPSSKSLGPCSAHERHVFSKMEDGENQRTLTLQSPVKSIEITSILNGLQGSHCSTWHCTLTV